MNASIFLCSCEKDYLLVELFMTMYNYIIKCRLLRSQYFTSHNQEVCAGGVGEMLILDG